MRKKRLGLFTIVLGLFLFLTACGTDGNTDATNDPTADEETNETEEKETTEQTDDRIISTTIALTEIMDELDLDLVGVPTSYKKLPERYVEATEVGNAAQPDMEIIRSLKPTDVLSATTLDAEFDLGPTFESANVPVTFVDMESIEGMYEGILQLGEKYERMEQAEQLINNFEEKVSEIEERVTGVESPSVLILLGIPGSYLVATENSYLGDLVKRAGGENAIQGEEVEYISSNTENLQQSNPDIILRAAHGMPDEVVKMFDKEFAESDIWKHFKAVQNDRVYDLEETLFGTTANLAVPEALDELVDILYPDEP